MIGVDMSGISLQWVLGEPSWLGENFTAVEITIVLLVILLLLAIFRLMR